MASCRGYTNQHTTHVMFVGTFSTTSRPALRAAACGGRPRAGSDTTVPGSRPHPPSKGSRSSHEHAAWSALGPYRSGNHGSLAGTSGHARHGRIAGETPIGAPISHAREGVQWSSSLPNQLPRAHPGSCPRGAAYRGRASPCGRAGSHRRQVGAGLFSLTVPPACHKQRSPAVSSGQSRSLEGGRWSGCPLLTWGGEEAETAWHARGQG
jgi:hypothetical protein